MVMRILIVEDDPIQSKRLQADLKENGYVVHTLDNGLEAEQLLGVEEFALAIFDVNLPGMSGLELLQTVRERELSLPVIMLTTRAQVEHRVEGLSLGADDYLGKPYDRMELLARVNAVLRRSYAKPNPVFQIGDLSVDLNRREVKRSEKKVALSTREFNLLEVLVLANGKVVSRQELLDQIYDIDIDRDSNVLDVYISYLRRKIDKGHETQLIHTVRGKGYILEARN